MFNLNVEGGSDTKTRPMKLKGKKRFSAEPEPSWPQPGLKIRNLVEHVTSKGHVGPNHISDGIFSNSVAGGEEGPVPGLHPGTLKMGGNTHTSGYGVGGSFLNRGDHFCDPVLRKSEVVIRK